MTQTKCRVLLIDDHEDTAEMLTMLLGQQDYEVNSAVTMQEALEQAKSGEFDLYVLDKNLPDGSGLDAARKVRESNPTMGIVVLTMNAGDDQHYGALEAGASAFVPKDAPAEDVISAARHAAVSPRAFTATDLAGAMQRRLSPSGPQLSPREREVLGLLADGLGVAAISKVYEKLGAANRAQALMTAMRLGLIANPADQGF